MASPTFGQFDLDHVGAELAQLGGAERAGQKGRDVQDLAAFQGLHVDHLAALQHAAGALHDGIVDELAIELDRRQALRFGFVERLDDALGLGDGGVIGGERGVGAGDLVGMDAHLALKAELRRRAGRRR